MNHACIQGEGGEAGPWPEEGRAGHGAQGAAAVEEGAERAAPVTPFPAHRLPEGPGRLFGPWEEPGEIDGELPQRPIGPQKVGEPVEEAHHRWDMVHALDS